MPLPFIVSECCDDMCNILLDSFSFVKYPLWNMIAQVIINNTELTRHLLRTAHKHDIHTYIRTHFSQFDSDYFAYNRPQSIIFNLHSRSIYELYTSTIVFYAIFLSRYTRCVLCLFSYLLCLSLALFNRFSLPSLLFNPSFKLLAVNYFSLRSSLHSILFERN